jgi:CubicO group peptidase (beta-lactamase class C family)
MKRAIRVVLLTLLAALIVFWFVRGQLLVRIAAGATSQVVCSKTFVAGLAPDDVYAQDVRPEAGMQLIDWALRYDVDRARKEVRTTVLGFVSARAIYRDGLGCTLLYSDAPLDPGVPAALTAAGHAPAIVPQIAGNSVVEPSDPALRQALDRAFSEPAAGPRRWTQAVVIVRDGRAIAERYASGYGIDTPLLSHSIAKSVISALIGILVRQGKLSVAEPVPLAADRQAERQPRTQVTIDHLLRMDSGLPLDEGVGPGPAQQMWFTEGDEAAFAERTLPVREPGTGWGYSNLGYAVLSHILRETIGGSPQDITAFARRELFDPIGMRHALIEYDAAGTPSGANAMYATAREWAQFGLLYLNDGEAGGRRILPEGWVAYSTTPTLDTAYGAGFWLNNATTKPIPVWGAPWGMPGAPRDAFFGRGYLGQYVVVVPSEQLVVVRFGASHIPGGDITTVGTLVQDVIAALHTGGRQA